jgi:putative acetyltransferase
VPGHLPELVDLWVEAWRQTMPAIDFEARRAWFVDHLVAQQDKGAQIVCAFDAYTAEMAGFITIEPASGYINQLAVAHSFWGSAAAAELLVEARRRSPAELWLDVNQDNPRAVRFYEKQGFERESESVNPNSGLKIWRYRWRAAV